MTVELILFVYFMGCAFGVITVAAYVISRGNHE